MISAKADSSIAKPSDKLIFISDLHIRQESDFYYQCLIDTLERLTPRADKIFIVLGGDIFESCVGSKSIYHKMFPRLFRSLKKFRGVALPGNHDFAHEKLFFPWQVKDGPIRIQLDIGTVIVDHGDRCDPRDVGYLRLRSFLRSSLARVLIELSPGWLLYNAGLFFSSQSQDYVARLKFSDSRDGRNQYLRQTFRQWADRFPEASVVICGHSHLKDQVPLANNRWYLNPGFPAHAQAWPLAAVVDDQGPRLTPLDKL